MHDDQTKIMKKCITSHEKKYPFPEKTNAYQVMTDKSAVILLESSYSFLALAISARKRGLEGVARLIFLLITTTTNPVNNLLVDYLRLAEEREMACRCNAALLLTSFEDKWSLLLFCHFNCHHILTISRKGKGGERQLADLAGPNHSSSQVKIHPSIVRSSAINVLNLQNPPNWVKVLLVKTKTLELAKWSADCCSSWLKFDKWIHWRRFSLARSCAGWCRLTGRCWGHLRKWKWCRARWKSQKTEIKLSPDDDSNFLTLIDDHLKLEWLAKKHNTVWGSMVWPLVNWSPRLWQLTKTSFGAPPCS